MGIYWSGQHIPSLPDFETYLGNIRRVVWAKNSTIHHTWRPRVEDWRGMASMAGLKRHYQTTMGWDRGPHLFLASGSLNPSHDGIWIGTPLDITGIHAGVCNSTRFGIEIVGNYDDVSWSSEMADLVYGVLILLGRYMDFDPSDVNGHRECLPNKSCPGRAINMDAVRAEVKRRMEPDWQHEFGDQPFIAASGFGQTFVWAYRQGKPLGRALTPEFSDSAGVTMQRYQYAILTYTDAAGVTLYRKEQL